MAELKTRRNKASVRDFINGVENEQRRKDCRVVMKMMKAITGHPPEMWGDSIVGYGTSRYKYASGREGDWMLTGFSPRKQNLTLYVMSGFRGTESLMKKLGKHKTGKSCLYINKLEDIDLDVLHELITRSVAHMKSKS